MTNHSIHKTMGTVTYTVTSTNGKPDRIIGMPICPDLLDITAIGAADNWRGRFVRGFFQMMRLWPTATRW
jgi:hypothetical protein